MRLGLFFLFAAIAANSAVADTTVFVNVNVIPMTRKRS